MPDPSPLVSLPDQGEAEAIWRKNGFQKGKTRLEQKIDARPLKTVNEQQFKKIIRERDRMRCRRCGRKVIVTLARVPERAEVHHVHGRTGDLRFDDRAALLLCAEHHEQVTGQAFKAKLLIVATKTFTTKQGTFTDARQRVTFQVIG